MPGHGDVPPDVVARLDAVPSLTGRDWRAQELTGGLTNRNFRVSTAEGDYVARLAHPSGGLLSIDRDAEHACSVAAAAGGVAPKVVDYVPAVGVLMIEWVQGRTYQEQDLQDAANLPAVVRALRTLHSGPSFGVRFDMFATQCSYLDVVQRKGFRLPPGYLDFAPTMDRIRAALRANDPGTVPCHNDLLAANLIDDGQRIWLIDYEYAGDNDPYFELGNLWSESHLDDALLPELIELYDGRITRNRLARARLQATVGQYGWMLWAAIQDGVSGLDFDFWSWGTEKYDRAVATMRGPDLERWLADVQRDD